MKVFRLRLGTNCFTVIGTSLLVQGTVTVESKRAGVSTVTKFKKIKQ
jgi:hypothetical protein